MQIFTTEVLAETMPTDKSPESEESIIPKYLPGIPGWEAYQELSERPGADPPARTKFYGSSAIFCREIMWSVLSGRAKQIITTVPSTFMIYEKRRIP